jgi:hypothetical protein
MHTLASSNRSIRLLIALSLLAALLLPASATLAEMEEVFDVQFSGVIDAVPAAAGDPWQVAGYTVAVNATTRVRLTTGPAAEGMWADVRAQRLADDSLLALDIVARPPEVRLKGPLTAKPEDGIGAWIIAGQTIWVTADTVFSQRSGPIEVGQWVEVYAMEDVEEADGKLIAVRVRGIESCEDVEVYGAIQSFGDTQWILSRIPVGVTPNTLVLGQPHLGLLAHAAAEVTDTGLEARVFKVDWLEPKRGPIIVQFSGVIEALPEDSLLGLWQVNGQTVEVLESTQLFQVKGLAVVGAHVHVTGWQGAESIVATSITVLASPSGSGQTFAVRGNIEALPQGGLLGAWTIAGQKIQVTRQTRIHGEQFVRLGSPAEAGGLQYQNGVRQTTWVRVREMAGPGPQPSQTPQPTHTPTGGPSATPPTSGPGPQPSQTPQPTHCPGNGPCATVTPGRP